MYVFIPQMSVDSVDQDKTVSQRLRDGETLRPHGSLPRATTKLTNYKTEFSVSKKTLLPCNHMAGKEILFSHWVSRPTAYEL